MFLSVNKSSISRFLEQAVLSDERRKSFIYKALHTFIQNESLESTAFIWGNNGIENYHIVTAGIKETEVLQWLSQIQFNLSDYSFLYHEKTSPLKDFTVSIFPTMNDHEITGLWIIWGEKTIPSHDTQISFILPYLEVITVIDRTKEITVDSNLLHNDLIEAFQYKDPSAIIAMLSLFRIISDADLVYWGDIINSTITITHHLGAKKNNFGFELPIGKGFGGKAAHSKNMLAVDDYKNSPYRFHPISSIIDRESLRSGIVIPIKDKQIQTSGLLYVTRREIKPFTLLQQLSLLKIIQSVEPLQYEASATTSVFISNHSLYPLAKRKNELRKLSEQEKDLVALEKWAKNILKGTFIVVDHNEAPYTIERNNELFDVNLKEVPLVSINGVNFGKIYYSSPIQFHHTNWPDIIDDIASACRIILERQMLLQRGETYKYTVWIHSLLTDGPNNELFYEGMQLGLPIEKGEVWVLSWDDELNLSQNAQLRLEQLTIKLLKRKLLVFEQYAILLLNQNDNNITPELLRNALLQMYPMKLWLVHGATYDSFSELKGTIEHSIEFIQKVKNTDDSQFIIEINHSGLDMLFREDDLHNKLESFSMKILKPLLNYDLENNTNFTETLVYDSLLKSPDEVAKHLFIHKNTVLYRVKRAKEILNIDTNVPKNRIALELAAYQWIKKNNPSVLTALNMK